jgi:hypothetical protein
LDRVRSSGALFTLKNKTWLKNYPWTKTETCFVPESVKEKKWFDDIDKMTDAINHFCDDNAKISQTIFSKV